MSKAAIVRLKHNKRIVGFLTYVNLKDLFWLIDECCDPYACEFKNIESGGFLWKKPDAQELKDYLKEDDDFEHDFNGADVSEGLYEDAFSDDGWNDVSKKMKYSLML